jgi:hypothetical protein
MGSKCALSNGWPVRKRRIYPWIRATSHTTSSLIGMQIRLGIFSVPSEFVVAYVIDPGIAFKE